MTTIETDCKSVGQQWSPQTQQGDNRVLRQACEEFAAVFWNQLLASLRDTVPEGGLFPASAGEKVFNSMLDTEYAQIIARSEGSLAEVLFRQLNRA